MNLDQLKQAGFTDQEIAGYVAEKAPKLLMAGFKDEEIKSYFGQPAGGLEIPAPEPEPFDFDNVFDDLNFYRGEDPGGYKADVTASLAPVVRPFAAQGYNTLAALNRGFASFMTHLDSISEYVSEKTGMERSGILGPDFLKKVADYYEKDSRYWAGRARSVGINFIDELVSEAAGGAMPGIAEFILNVPYSATLGAAEAYKKGESEIAGALVEGAKRGVLGAVFHAMAPLRKYLQAPLMGGTFAVQTAAEGGSAREIAKAAGTGALYAATSPGGRLGLNDLKKDLTRTLVEEEAKSPRIEPTVEEAPIETKGEGERQAGGPVAAPEVAKRREGVPGARPGRERVPEGEAGAPQEIDKKAVMASPDWDAARKKGDIEAATRIVTAAWPDRDSESVRLNLTNPENAVYLTIPRVSPANNMIPGALAERLAADLGGEVLNGADYIKPLEGAEAKKAARGGVVEYPKGYEGIDLEGLKAKVAAKEVVVVDDTGRAVRPFLKALVRGGIESKTIAYLMKPEPSRAVMADKKTIQAFQDSLDRAQIKMNAGDIAGDMTRSEVLELMASARKAKTEEDRKTLADDLQNLIWDKTGVPAEAESQFAPKKGFRREPAGEIIAYHGTPGKFERLEIGFPSPRDKSGKHISSVISLTDDPSYAKRHAGKTGTVGEYRVDLKNPLDLGDGEATMTIDTFLKKINSPKSALDLNLNPTGWTTQWQMVSYNAEVVQILKDQGYDGVIWKENKGKSTTYSVFSADQVKPSNPALEGGERIPFSPKAGFRREPEVDISPGEITGRADILRFLQEKMGIPIRTGRFREKALGLFKVGPEVIRTRNFADIEAASHEIGHALQKFLWPETFGRIDRDMPLAPFGQELADLSGGVEVRPGSSRLGEGFAEFIRLYVTDGPAAEKRAPHFYNFFDGYLERKSPESREVLLQARADYDRYMKQPAYQRVRSQVSIGEDQKKRTSLDDLYTMVMDEFHPLNVVQKKMLGKEPAPITDKPYNLARLFNGWLGKVNAFLRHSPFEYETMKDVGTSLEDILKPFKNDLEELSTYMVARRVPGLAERGIDTGIRPEDAQAVVDRLNPKYSEVFSQLEGYQDHLLTYLKDAGILAPEAYDRIRSVSTDYDPFYRVFEEKVGGGGIGRGLQAYQPIKEIKGSWERIQDPIESIIKNTLLYMNLAERNAVGRAMVDLATKKEGLGKFVEEIPTPFHAVQVQLEEILKPQEIEAIKKAGIKPEEFYTVFRPNAFTATENVVSVWIDGMQHDYQVTPEVYRTFRALDREGANAIEKLVSYPARWLRAGSVLTPEFIARNPFRDQFSAYINSRYGFIPGVDLMRGVFHLLKKDDLYWKWQKSGGAQATLASMDRDYFQQELGKILQDSPVLNLIKNPVEALRVLGELGEVGTRLGEFAKGLKKEGEEKAGILTAGLASREITTDFQRIGAKTRAVNALISFWNANVQGMDREIRAFRDNPLPTTLKALASITLPSILLTWANHDDPRYQEVPQWQKDLFWIVIPDHMSKERWAEMSDQEKSEHMKWITGSLWRFPKPWELGIVFGTIPERMVNYALDQDPEAFDKLGESIWRTVAPGVIPTFLVPWLENKANYSFFFDRKVVPGSREDLPPQYQYAPYTTEAAKKIGEVLGKMPFVEKTDFASPAKVENLVRGWTGGLGYYALQIASEGLTRTGLAEEGPPKPLKTFADIPLIKAFAVRYPQAGAESVQDFYDHYKEAAGIEKSIATMAKEFKYEKALTIMAQDYSGTLKGHYQAISNLHDMIELTYNHPDMTPEEKREIIDISYFQMIQIAHDGNQMIKEIKKVVNDAKKEPEPEPRPEVQRKAQAQAPAAGRGPREGRGPLPRFEGGTP